MNLIRAVKAMSEVKVVRRRSSGQQSWSTPAELAGRPEQISIVAVGASTGGPVTLQAILSRIPVDFQPPIVIVQHMAPGFLEGLVQWLSQSSALPIRIAASGEEMMPGTVYLAPDEGHLVIDRRHRLNVTADAPENGVRPSIAHLFRSVADVFGQRSACVLLSGMGTDGAAELKRLKDLGGVAIVQDKASSVVYGMPGEALRLGTNAIVLSPERIASVLGRLAARSQSAL